uniref:Uncharacterized protein n=1 Tax=Timspurckia oligopyrenoides TaxID=708627 RepID=A0A6T6M6H8_9RHOD|mmetsp:Transcript_1966/g.3499  ORF Transcript_1966/g.3499 Transcript_1966/m.3499 type:complete len:196 (+) Transcript_1966:235-822(+)
MDMMERIQSTAGSSIGNGVSSCDGLVKNGKSGQQHVSPGSTISRVSVQNLLCNDEPEILQKDVKSDIVSDQGSEVFSSIRAKEWTPEEDQMLKDLVEKYGTRAWHVISHVYFKDTRSGAQVRSRYVDVINPNRSRAPWTQEEDVKLIQLHAKYGNKWSKLAEHFENRVSNDIKNRYRDMKKALARSMKKNQAQKV